jgi:plasmid stabilization system protein ParE
MSCAHRAISDRLAVSVGVGEKSLVNRTLPGTLGGICGRSEKRPAQGVIQPLPIMARGDKSSYTGKQKRKAEHIEEGYRKRGVSKGEAEERAWRTVNKQDGGAKGGGKAKRSSSRRASSRRSASSTRKSSSTRKRSSGRKASARKRS